MAGMFDIFKWGMKPPTTLGGYAGDIEGEAQMPSMIGQRITKSQGGPIPIPQQNQGALQPNAQGANITMADGASLAKWAGLDLKQLERNTKCRSYIKRNINMMSVGQFFIPVFRIIF